MSSELPLCDFTQPLELQAVRELGRQVVRFAHALPRHRRQSGEVAGQLRLSTEHCDWLLPADPLPTGLVPAPGDTLQSGDERWLVQTAEVLVGGSVWRCHCRLQA
ncbi:MAG: hypothetical protein ACK6D3_06340 [Planctomycetaceae bacterium]